MASASDQLHALDDFRQARRQAAMQQIMARLTGQTIDLLSYEEVRRRFRLGTGSSRGLHDIPLDSIVGSVSRYTDFTRSFLPKEEIDEHRWAGVKAATMDLAGLPPIEVYQIGQVYFVVDGNHRVSVARQLGNKTIEAYVTEFKTKIPLTPDDNPDDILLKAEYASFLEKTNLDQLRPDTGFTVTVPGRYWELETQIEAHQFLKEKDEERKIPYDEAVRHWYDHVYMPIIQIIRERAILRDFPGRTETDLYLWIFRHRAELEKQLGWKIDPETAALDLAHHHSSTPARVMSRVEEKLTDTILPDELEAGPLPGQWRRDWLEARPRDKLFAKILVPLSGQDESWNALDLALKVAQHEQGQLYGLHVVPTPEEAETDETQAAQTQFHRRCQRTGVTGELLVEVGYPGRKIVERAGWSDLVVAHLAHPPGAQVIQKLTSGFRTLLHRCPRPMLIAPNGATSFLQRALLAYDGSPKAKEGLYISTYLAERWQIPLAVITVQKQNEAAGIQAEARQYLEQHNINATYITKKGTAAELILQTAAEQSCDLIIMGGYGFQPLLEVVLGSTVDQILRETRTPLLICR